MQSKWSAWNIWIFIICLIMICTTAEAATSEKSTVSLSKTSGTVVKVSSDKKTPPKAVDTKLKRLQQLLADTGFYPGEMSGVLASSTKDAIVRAQRMFKLEQTGKYDQKLVDVLAREARIRPNKYRKKLSMQATAYTSQDPGCGNLTKREHLLRRGLVAVDPKVIPLGSRLYIEGYGYAIADDIGSAIKGTKIDLAYESRSEAFNFGRKMVTVFVLD
ncbi:3D domain-containing protein [Sporomusa malonica]|uniref:3D (Asp-Asp-Asp) domain-containing protein n=1 Tax=Sporomusa malonica TaxID=112901 RepID=A0A1W2ER97_9FIRM|nr:3D domain-containing protein [Sporomusa malonica]SMD12239.1 3D (Asp-Asp-Asp) domain-containing protein [Sporomusa malonica]